MTTFIAAAVFMILVVGAMSIGVLFGRKPIAGSCGGLNALGMKSACEVCGGDQQRCDEEQQKRGKGARIDLAYDAMAEPDRR